MQVLHLYLLLEEGLIHYCGDTLLFCLLEHIGVGGEFGGAQDEGAAEPEAHVGCFQVVHTFIFIGNIKVKCSN